MYTLYTNMSVHCVCPRYGAPHGVPVDHQFPQISGRVAPEDFPVDSHFVMDKGGQRTSDLRLCSQGGTGSQPRCKLGRAGSDNENQWKISQVINGNRQSSKYIPLMFELQ